jgi:hypothetical protein
MGSFKHPRVFDPLDLEIIDKVYEAAWAQIESRDLGRDMTLDQELRETLRKQVFACAFSGRVDFDTLYESVIANWARSQSKRTGPAA